jgi:hypothetical protein
MTDVEIKKSIQNLRMIQKKVKQSKSAALKFLVDAGIATKKGNLRSVYR